MRRDLLRRRAREGGTKSRDINEHNIEGQQRHDDRNHRHQRQHDSRRPASAPRTTASSGSAAPVMAARATASGPHGQTTWADGGEREYRDEEEEVKNSLTTSHRRTTSRSPSSGVARSLLGAAARGHRHHPARPITLQVQGGSSGRISLANRGIDDDRGADKRHPSSSNAVGVK